MVHVQNLVNLHVCYRYLLSRPHSVCVSGSCCVEEGLLLVIDGMNVLECCCVQKAGKV
jgi:hypothetical protein